MHFQTWVTFITSLAVIALPVFKYSKGPETSHLSKRSIWLLNKSPEPRTGTWGWQLVGPGTWCWQRRGANSWLWNQKELFPIHFRNYFWDLPPPMGRWKVVMKSGASTCHPVRNSPAGWCFLIGLGAQGIWLNDGLTWNLVLTQDEYMLAVCADGSVRKGTRKAFPLSVGSVQP